jgi:hypothetical protein
MLTFLLSGWSSTPHTQLNTQHAAQRRSYAELESHIAWVRSLPGVFGLSDHDLLFSKGEEVSALAAADAAASLLLSASKPKSSSTSTYSKPRSKTAASVTGAKGPNSYASGDGGAAANREDGSAYDDDDEDDGVCHVRRRNRLLDNEAEEAAGSGTDNADDDDDERRRADDGDSDADSGDGHDDSGNAEQRRHVGSDTDEEDDEPIASRPKAVVVARRIIMSPDSDNDDSDRPRPYPQSESMASPPRQSASSVSSSSHQQSPAFQQDEEYGHPYQHEHEQSAADDRDEEREQQYMRDPIVIELASPQAPPASVSSGGSSVNSSVAPKNLHGRRSFLRIDLSPPLQAKPSEKSAPKGTVSDRVHQPASISASPSSPFADVIDLCDSPVAAAAPSSSHSRSSRQSLLVLSPGSAPDAAATASPSSSFLPSTSADQVDMSASNALLSPLRGNDCASSAASLQHEPHSASETLSPGSVALNSSASPMAHASFSAFADSPSSLPYSSASASAPALSSPSSPSSAASSAAASSSVSSTCCAAHFDAVRRAFGFGARHCRCFASPARVRRFNADLQRVDAALSAEDGLGAFEAATAALGTVPNR